MDYQFSFVNDLENQKKSSHKNDKSKSCPRSIKNKENGFK